MLFGKCVSQNHSRVGIEFGASFVAACVIVFYNETHEPQQPVPVPIADHMEGYGYFPDSGMHWILDR